MLALEVRSPEDLKFDKFFLNVIQKNNSVNLYTTVIIIFKMIYLVLYIDICRNESPRIYGFEAARVTTTKLQLIFVIK